MGGTGIPAAGDRARLATLEMGTEAPLVAIEPGLRLRPSTGEAIPYRVVKVEMKKIRTKRKNGSPRTRISSLFDERQ